MTKALTGKVIGQVQGVGFRYSALAMAQRFRVAGWVRNDPDGGVAFLVQGEAASVDLMLDWLKRGPPGAAVQRCSSTVQTYDPLITDFRIRH
jgi:acylphosphatase